MADNPGRLVVPTLDVDLAWHTHMLSPKTYAAASIRKTGTLLDHPDKIDEDKLSMAFAWTCKIYAEKYGQSYSDCACWYCESVRAMSGELPSKRTSPEQCSTYAHLLMLYSSRHQRPSLVTNSTSCAHLRPPLSPRARNRIAARAHPRPATRTPNTAARSARSDTSGRT